MPIAASLRQIIAERDIYRCSYCLTTEANCGLRMHIDHIIPESAGGLTIPENICPACFSCNVSKGAQQTGFDSQTGKETSLFHPLRQKWSEHFTWDESKTRIVGRTACGRATIAALHMNNPTIVRARYRWVSAGWHPPDV